MLKNTFYIKTLGCKVNQYESQVIRENFLRDGYVEAGTSDDADICVVNTCTVTSASDSKSLRLIHKALKDNKRVVATGCMVEDKGLDLLKFKGVNFIIRNEDKYNIPKIIVGDRHACPLPAITGFKGHARAFVKIQDGCDNACSYCKVTIVRGRSKSRPLEDIIEECAGLIANGYREIVLTGICLGAYTKGISKGMGLSELVKELCKIKGDWRMRFSSIEPGDINDGLIAYIKSEEKICKHLHIPFQSGDDEVLKRMNRPYAARDYIDIVRKLRRAVPGIAISTDMMVGFPGERECHFQNTMNFIKEIQPMRLHVFGFSKRAGTIASNYKEAVSEDIKKQREHELMDLVKGFTKDFEGLFIGKAARVLVEDRRDVSGFLQGYTDRYIKALIDGPDTIQSKLVTCQLAYTPSLLPAENPYQKQAPGLTNQKVYGILLSYLE